MATVQIAPDDLLEVPDDWDSQQITNHIREVRPGLFVDTNLTYNPPSTQQGPTAGQMRMAGEREAALSEQKRIDSILARIADTGEAGVLERAGELLARGTGNIVSGSGSLARLPIEVAQELLPAGISRALGTLWQASSLGRLSDAGRTSDSINNLIPSRAPSFGEARALASNSQGLERVMPFIEMAAQASGENAPQLAASMATAGISGLQALSPTVRAALASFLTALPQEAGGIYQGMRDKGVAPTKAAAITGIAGPAAAALEAVSDIPLLGRVLGEGSRSLRKLPGRIVGNAALEGGTEVAQELAAIGAETAAGKPPSKDEIVERLGSSFIGGLGAGAGSSTVVDVARRAIEGPDKIQPPEIKPHKFVEIAKKYGVAPDQIEVVPRKITPEELKAIGHTGEIQAYVTPEGKIRAFEPSITSNKEFDEIVREEVWHKKLDTTEGKQAVSSFAENNPLTETELDKLRAYTRAEGETDLQHKLRLTNEFLAKLDRDTWWTKFVDRFKAAVKPIVGVPLNNREAGRVLLRNMSPRVAQQSAEVSALPTVRPAPAQSQSDTTSATRDQSQNLQRITELRKQLAALPEGGAGAEEILGELNTAIDAVNRGASEPRQVQQPQVAPTGLPVVASLPSWVRDEMVRRGIDPKRPLNDVDLGNASVREAVELDPTMTREQKDSLLKYGQIKPPAPASIGTAASSRRSVQITEKVVRDFPGLRVQYNDPPAGDTGEAVQVGPDGTVHVNPKKAEPRSVRRQIIEAAVKSGTMMLRDADRDSVFSVMAQARPKEVANEARRIGADVNTGEGRMKVLANLLANRSPKSPFMRRLMTRMQLPKEDAKLVERSIDVALDRFRSAEPMRFGEVDAGQIYADDNAPTYALKPLLQALRDIASTLEVRSLARRQFKVVDDHVNQLLQAARARILADPSRTPDDDNGEPAAINPASSDFLDLIQKVGVPVTQQDAYIHHVYRTELVARQLLGIDINLSRLRSIKANLESAVQKLALKTYSPEQIDAEIEQLDLERSTLLRRASSTDLDSGEIEARASEIRESDEAVPEAAAARRVMENPKVAEFTAIIDRIDDSGRTPRPVSDLTEFHASGVEVKHGVQRAAYRALSDAVKEARSKYLHGEYARQLTSLRKQWSAARAKSGAVEIEIHDVIQSLTRTLGLSGSLQGREAATLLRDQQSAIASFAVRLADAAPDTPAGRLREAIIALPSNGTLQPSTEIRTLAAQSGVSEDLLTSVLKYIQDVPEFHNAVVTLFERASARVHQATVTAIERIENALDDETKEGDELANRIADEQLGRLRDRNRNLTSRANSIESQLAKLEDERLYWEKFGEFTSVEMPDAKGDRRMIHPIENGHIFLSFKYSGGEQPEVTLKSGDMFTQQKLRQMIEWQQNSTDAIANHTTDEQTRRGLIAVQQAVSEYIDASFTQDQIVRALAPGKLMGALDKLFTRTAENLAKYVPGFFGDRVRKTAAAYDNTGGKIERLKTKHVSTFNKMFRRAGESLGLNLRVPGESARLGTAYNEVAHRLRQNGSGVAEGDTLLWDTVRGKQVTPELLNLIRYTRSMGREGQLILEKTLYGGVRVDLPGRQIVRPPAETGDLGLGRLSNKAKTIRLADIYRAAVDASGKTQGVSPDAPQVIDFWDQDPDALLSSIDDMNRSDIGIEVDPMLRKIAAIAMRGIRQRGDTVPNTIDEWVDRLFGIADPGIPDRGGQTVRPAGGQPEIRTKLLAHLAQYGRVAASKHPPGSKAPVHGSGVIVGEDDRTEFSSPAAPLMYPGSYYEYGSASGLSSFLGRVADLAQVDYLAALNAAAAHLRARIFAMQEAIKGDLTPFKEEILYHTADILSGQEIDKQRAEMAIERMKQHADRIEREVAGIEQGSPSIKLISKVVATFAAWILAGPRAMMTNVLSGPIGAHQLNKQVFGVWRGTLQTLNNFIYASPHFAYDMVSALARTVIREDMLPLFLRQHEMRDYLESDGIGGSYDREELKQVDSFADGFSEKSAGERLYAANQAAARNVQDVIGVRLGDRSLNRFAVRRVIPGIIRQLNRIASEYAGRLAALGVEGPDATRPETLLSADDSRHVMGAREFLAEFGNPEEILLRLHRGEVDTRRFFRSELGKKIGTSILYRFNPASRTNRPMSNDMVLFLGWTSHQMQMMAAAYRNPVEVGRSQKVWHTMNSLASDALVGLVAAYTSMAIGGTLLGGAAASLRAIGKLLSGDPPPEDEGGLWSWLEHKLAYMVGLLKKVPILGFGVNTASRVFDATGKALTPAAKLTPDKVGFWDRPIADIAIDMAKAAPSAYGLSADSSRIPFVSMLEQGGSGAYQAMRGAGQYVAGWGDPGAEAGAKADIKAGIRTTMGMYGFAGQTLSDLLMPGGTEDRVVANAIKNAAHEEGVRIEPFTFNQQSFAAPTPIRKSLMEAGRKLSAGDQTAGTEIDGIAKFVYDRAYNRTINNGGTEEDAAKAGDSAVKSALRGLNPYEHAIGHTLTEGQYAALQKRLAGRPEVARDEQAANAVIDRISQSPPSGDPFNPSESMRSPVKVQPAPKRRGGKPRRSIRATRVSRRTLGRKLRFARSIA